MGIHIPIEVHTTRTPVDPRALRTFVAIVSLWVTLAAAPPAVAQDPVVVLYGTGVDDHLGHSVKSAGDLNADGVPDILAGAPFTSLGPGLEDAGRVWLFSGTSGTVLGTVEGTTCCSWLGMTLSPAGDLNLDGHDDFLVQEGIWTWAYSGRDISVLYQVVGNPDPLTGYGAAVASIGDLDSDTIPDFVVGANAANEVYGYSGADGSPLFVYGGVGSPTSLGDELAAAGDVDGDGVPDILAGARFDFPGTAQVLSGADGSVLWEFGGGPLAMEFGSAVAGDGDANGDGTPDFLIGDDGSAYVEPGAGSAFVYSGADGSLIHSIVGDEKWQFLGYSVDFLGDVDGDGCDEFAVGIQLADWSATNAGAVRVYSGKTGHVLYTFNGEAVLPNSGSRFGSSVSRLGDVNQDGVPDLVAGGPRASNPSGDADAGLVKVYALMTQVLEPPSPGTAAAQNSITLTGATPHGSVGFGWSASVGVTPLPFCGIASADLGFPQLIGIVQADAAGVAMVSGFVPGSASGKTILFQALDLSSCVVSNLVSHTFP